MKSVLFVCTGNYYRSRVAEILFNHFAKNEYIGTVAYSRGIRLNPAKNIGAISPHAVKFLQQHNIPAHSIEFPKKLEYHDLEKAGKVILLDEKEHRPMLRNVFPEWEHRVEYWNFEDDYIVEPEIVLPGLHQKIRQLIASLSDASGAKSTAPFS
jgi:protein-tyrosine phosphatase